MLCVVTEARGQYWSVRLPNESYQTVLTTSMAGYTLAYIGKCELAPASAVQCDGAVSCRATGGGGRTPEHGSEGPSSIVAAGPAAAHAAHEEQPEGDHRHEASSDAAVRSVPQRAPDGDAEGASASGLADVGVVDVQPAAGDEAENEGGQRPYGVTRRSGSRKPAAGEAVGSLPHIPGAGT